MCKYIIIILSNKLNIIKISNAVITVDNNYLLFRQKLVIPQIRKSPRNFLIWNFFKDNSREVIHLFEVYYMVTRAKQYKLSLYFMRVLITIFKNKLQISDIFDIKLLIYFTVLIISSRKIFLYSHLNPFI